MVMGSSGLSGMFISCIIAFPMDVTRRLACANLPWTVGSGGSVVTRPSQEPARVFSWSKDFCASDWAAADNERASANPKVRVCLKFMWVSYWTAVQLSNRHVRHLVL